jgi:hypothetical protein
MKFAQFNENSGVKIIEDGTASSKPNDISDTRFNPVIQKIEGFMTKREKLKISENNNNRISFLSIRNLWR